VGKAMNLQVMVFGPAYLDRVLRVDRPLIDPALGPPLDQSVEGSFRFGNETSLKVVDETGFGIAIELPDDWTGPRGSVNLPYALSRDVGGTRHLRGLSSSEELGGMGAGFAAALGGTLYHALGPEDDPISRQVASLLTREGVDHRFVRVESRPADWTLLVTSGQFGDKLAIGFRGCHAAVEPESFVADACSPCDLRVVAALPNRLAGPILAAAGARCRLLAPAMRNVLDHDPPLSSFASSIDLLCCNRSEWETLPDREEVAWKVSVLIITEGPAGACARFTTPQGDPGMVRVPAFPRARPPRDTNRAGESFAASLVSTLLIDGWDATSTVVPEDLMRRAMTRASASAALVLDHLDFAFPKPEEIDEALRKGCVD
jgi:ribokinase